MWPLFRRAAISFWQLTFLERSKNVVNTAMKWICVDCMNSKEFLVSFSRLSVRHQFMFHYQENSNEMQFVAVGWPLFIRFNSIAQVSESECQCNAAKWSFIKKTRNHYPFTLFCFDGHGILPSCRRFCFHFPVFFVFFLHFVNVGGCLSIVCCSRRPCRRRGKRSLGCSISERNDGRRLPIGRRFWNLESKKKK